LAVFCSPKGWSISRQIDQPINHPSSGRLADFWPRSQLSARFWRFCPTVIIWPKAEISASVRPDQRLDRFPAPFAAKRYPVV
jgi:hypothetical protein